jgi:hypothetical protein
LARDIAEPASSRFTAKVVLVAAVCLVAGVILGWLLARS